MRHLILACALVVVAGCSQQQSTSATDTYRSMAAIQDKASDGASKAANSYSECMILSTLVYRNSTEPASDIADAISATCARSLDEYELHMGSLYQVGTTSIASANMRARQARMDLADRLRKEAIRDIIDQRAKR